MSLFNISLFRKIGSIGRDRVREVVHVATNRLIHADDRLLATYIATNPLLGPPYRHFSQNDEDGITLRILRRLDLITPSTFLEIGAGDGQENNTLVLLALGWSGGWIDGRSPTLSTAGSRVTFVQEIVTRENCVSVATRSLPRGDLREVKVASVDIDGNDHHIVAALLDAGQMRPDLFIVEYNAKFPPEARFVMPYDRAHQWNTFDDYYGASLGSWCDLFERFDYQLVACNLTGVNAFFVNRKHSQKFQDVPRETHRLFVPGIHFIPATSGHRLSERTLELIIRGTPK